MLQTASLLGAGPYPPLVTLLIAAGGGWAFDALGIPMAWLIGPLTVTLLSRLVTELPRPGGGVHAMALVVVAGGIGAMFSPATVRLIGDNVLLIVAVVLSTLVLSLAVGFLLMRWTDLDLATALLSATPAGASGMAALSHELDANPHYVVTLHYVRLIVIVTLVPLVAFALLPGAAPLPASGAALGGPPVPAVAGVPAAVILLGIGGAGVFLARAIRMSFGGFIGPLLALLLARLVGLPPLEVPTVLVSGALLIIGTSIGAQFDRERMTGFGRNLGIGIGLMIGLIILCSALGYGLHRVTGIDRLTALLATAPGGMEVLTGAALEVGANAPLVLTVQLARLFTLVLVTPYLVRRFARMQRGA